MGLRRLEKNIFFKKMKVTNLALCRISQLVDQLFHAHVQYPSLWLGRMVDIDKGVLESYFFFSEFI